MKATHKPLLVLSACLLLALISACSWAGGIFGTKDEGGSYLVLAVKADPAQLDQTVQQTIAVIQKRCDQLGVKCTLQRQGGDKSDQIMLRISATKDPERIKSVLLSQGLELRAVVSPPSPAPVQTYSTRAEAETAAGTGNDVMPYRERELGQEIHERFVVVERSAIVTGEDIRDAEAFPVTDVEGYYQISFQLTPTGAQPFGEWTSANIKNYLAVVLNKEVRSAAYTRSQILDSGQIDGRFTKAEAEDVVMALRSGKLPAPIEALEEGVYKP